MVGGNIHMIDKELYLKYFVYRMALLRYDEFKLQTAFFFTDAESTLLVDLIRDGKLEDVDGTKRIFS